MSSTARTEPTIRQILQRAEDLYEQFGTPLVGAPHRRAWAFARAFGATRLARELGVARATVVTARRSGWVASVLLSSMIERHFYHLQSEIPTSERWQVQAEPQHVFQCYWLPLKAEIRLMEPQQEWLDSHFRAIKG